MSEYHLFHPKTWSLLWLSLQQHIAASKGYEHCVVFLLEYGADPNIKGNDHCFAANKGRCYDLWLFLFADSEGSVPLWEAISGKHESVVKILAENGALLSSGDVSQFACTAIEQNNLDLLKDIVHHGGDLTRPTSSETTLLHKAISEGNVEIVKFLIDQGAEIDKPDTHGWTPRALADHQGLEEIQFLFQSGQQTKKSSVFTIPEKQGLPYFGKRIIKYSSEPSMPPFSPEFRPPFPKLTRSDSQWRRRPNHFQNSLFGIISAANSGEHPV